MNTVTPLAVGLLCLLQTACALDARTQESLTTGDKLRAIDAAPRDASTWTQPSDDPAQRARMQARLPEWCNDLRARLLSGAPSMYAELWNERPPNQQLPKERLARARPMTAEQYANRGPGLYPPIDRERADLALTHAAGLLNDAEFEELSRLLTAQAKRPAFRRPSETHAVFVEGSVRSDVPHDNDSANKRINIVSTPDSRRQVAQGAWIRGWILDYANVESVPGAELPRSDANAPAEKWTRPWRRPDFWVDPVPPISETTLRSP
jgi:hypothetical protein